MKKYICALMFAILGSSVAERGFVTHTAANPLYSITRSVEDFGAKISNFFSKVGRNNSQNTNKINRSKTEGDEGFKDIFNNNNFNMYHLMKQQSIINNENLQNSIFSQNIKVPQALNVQHYLNLNNFHSSSNLNQILNNNTNNPMDNVIKIHISSINADNHKKANHSNITGGLNGTAPVMVTLPFFDKGLTNSGLPNNINHGQNPEYVRLQAKVHDDRVKNLNLMSI